MKTYDYQGQKYCFVEDNEVVLAAYRIAIERGGLLRPTGQRTACRRCACFTTPPDLVLLDLLLPRFNGVEVLHFIRSNARLKSLPGDDFFHQFHH